MIENREIDVKDPSIEIIENADEEETLRAILQVTQTGDEEVVWTINFSKLTADQLRCLADQFHYCANCAEDDLLKLTKEEHFVVKL